MSNLASRVTSVLPGSFEPANHWYEKALNAQLHPLVQNLMSLSSAQLIDRYCHLHPKVPREALKGMLEYEPRYFPWSGSDLFHVTSASGRRQMVVIEVNSCPSGQKSMPLLVESQEQGGYRRLLEETFLPRLNQRRKLPEGDLAVIYDKNEIENSGYASTLADLTGEPVLLAFVGEGDWNSIMEYRDRVLYLKDESGEWRPIRGAFRYVTQRPWTRIPINPRTFIFNPIISCLAGGRNKALAAKAYELCNAEFASSHLRVETPYTIWDVNRDQIPLWVRRLGGHAVIKVPYANAGQGVFTITSAQELDAFMKLDLPYEKLVVQSLIGNFSWSSEVESGRLYHIGTVPNKRGELYAADLRLMIHSTPSGFRPLALYARRGFAPLAEELSESTDSWNMLGTNLSKRRADGGWTTDTNRLLLVDRRDFNKLGLGLDDLIDGFIQAVMSTVAIDRMARSLITEKGALRSKLFRSLNEDSALLEEFYDAG